MHLAGIQRTKCWIGTARATARPTARRTARRRRGGRLCASPEYGSTDRSARRHSCGRLCISPEYRRRWGRLIGRPWVPGLVSRLQADDPEGVKQAEQRSEAQANWPPQLEAGNDGLIHAGPLLEPHLGQAASVARPPKELAEHPASLGAVELVRVHPGHPTTGRPPGAHVRIDRRSPASGLRRALLGPMRPGTTAAYSIEVHTGRGDFASLERVRTRAAAGRRPSATLSSSAGPPLQSDAMTHRRGDSRA